MFHIYQFVVFVYCFVLISGSIFPVRNNYKSTVNYTSPEDEVFFHLYHSSDLSTDDPIIVGDENSVKNSRFNPELPTKFIIHGWTHGKDLPWVKEMREAMANTNKWNIIVVDWSILARAFYTEARIHTTSVGRQLAKFCKFLAETSGAQIPTYHMIGHSMGAQIAAMAGVQLQKECGASFERITGLDPAAPLYEWPHVESLDDILDPSDAQFVDVIHTNGKHLGIIFPSGHVDYYPNGGEKQPGCALWVCSHMRSCEFWTASIIKPDLFQAYSFNSWDEYLAGQRNQLISVPMGIAADSRIPYGSYFLETTNEERAYLNTTTTIFDTIQNIKNPDFF